MPIPTNPKIERVKIRGAGPAGLAAAIVLAGHGASVQVYERRKQVGGRFHNDYQGVENWSSPTSVLAQLAQFGINLDGCIVPISAGILYNQEHRPLHVTSAEPILYLVERGPSPTSLDSLLFKQASEAGATIHLGRSAPDDVHIDASGPRMPKAIAVGTSFRTELPEMAIAIADKNLAPGGYGYFLSAKGRATMACVSFSHFSHVRRSWEMTAQAFGSLLGTEFPKSSLWGGYGEYRLPTTCMQNGCRVAGEAAGFQDPLFGFGIRMALVSGCLAAMSLLTGKNYDALWKASLARQMGTLRVNRFLYDLCNSWFTDLIWRTVGTSQNPKNAMRILYTWVPGVMYPLVGFIDRMTASFQPDRS